MSNFSSESTATEVATALAARIAGKVVLITGCAPNSLGEAAALTIAPHSPALLILSGRNHSLVEETEKTILAKASSVKTRLLTFDLANLKSVRQAVTEVENYPEQIDVLFNNAGIMATPFEKTVDGFESQFAVNHIGPFLFTMLLVKKFARGGRILNISSGGYAFGGVRYDDPNFENQSYDKWLSYAQSKTANILFSEAIADRLGSKGIFSFSLTPGGGVYTNLGRHLTPEDLEMLSSVTIITKEQAVATYIVAGFDPELETHNGAFMEFCKPVPTKEECAWARGKENADKLWALSEKMVGEKFSFDA
ncbi:NAD(P)-binding protein [Cadophora sp. DSE1049]|nr:NAD(P)-binding protein [Cadophora sp. DSE1049]